MLLIDEDGTYRFYDLLFQVEDEMVFQRTKHYWQQKTSGLVQTLPSNTNSPQHSHPTTTSPTLQTQSVPVIVLIPASQPNNVPVSQRPVTQYTFVATLQISVSQPATQPIPTSLPVPVAPVHSSPPLTTTLSNEGTDLLDVIVSTQPKSDTSLVQNQKFQADTNWDTWEAHTSSQ
jgi:hypothetical protein